MGFNPEKIRKGILEEIPSVVKVLYDINSKATEHNRVYMRTDQGIGRQHAKI